MCAFQQGGVEKRELSHVLIDTATSRRRENTERTSLADEVLIHFFAVVRCLPCPFTNVYPVALSSSRGPVPRLKRNISSAARSKGALDDGFGSADSDTDNAADCRELQFFPSSASKRVPNLGDRARDKVILPRWPPVAAPIAGWTTPRSIPSSLIASKQFIEGSGRKDWGGAEGGANEGPFTPPSPAIAESFSVPNSDGAGSSPSLVPARVAVAAPSSLAGLGPWGVQLDNI